MTAANSLPYVCETCYKDYVEGKGNLYCRHWCASGRSGTLLDQLSIHEGEHEHVYNRRCGCARCGSQRQADV